MTKEESKTVKLGDTIKLVDISLTPGRKFSPILAEEVVIEGMLIEDDELPLKSRDTGEEIDGSQIYWMNPSRFKLINE